MDDESVSIETSGSETSGSETSSCSNDAYTVSELNREIKEILKLNFDKRISVTGEISNYKESYNNVYLTLKDAMSRISIVSWDHKRKHGKLGLKNGDKILVDGIITVFEKSGSYQITAFDFKLYGLGDLYKKYIETKESYETKGYFSDKNKRALPKYIRNIGIITASGGAALKDMLYVLKKSNYLGNIYIKNCIVQGKDCPTSAANCIKELDKLNYDAIIVSRGGGSFEDLFGFSDSKVIEAIHNAKTCIISAIGHEVDFMLSDFVADIRSPTPSVAGEIIATHQKKQYSADAIQNIIKDVYYTISKNIGIQEKRINDAQNKIVDPYDISKECIRTFDSLLESIELNLRKKLIECYNKQKSLDNKFSILNPMNSLNNGFVIASSNKSIIKSINNLDEIKKLKLQFIDGSAIITIKDISLIKNE